MLQRQWQHGGFLLEPDPEGVNAAIVRFTAGRKKVGGEKREVAPPRGAVKRAWAVVFAKRKKKNKKKKGDEAEAPIATDQDA